MDQMARFLWVVEIMEINPDDRVLEIGCGVGLAVDQIAKRLGSGSVTAIDRSQPMISKAMARNSDALKEKKAVFILSDLIGLGEGSHWYDKIFAFNVNLFWTKKAIEKEIVIIKSHLARNGHLYLFYQPPSLSGMKLLTQAVGDKLESHGFKVVHTAYEKNVASCCIISRPSEPPGVKRGR